MCRVMSETDAELLLAQRLINSVGLFLSFRAESRNLLLLTMRDVSTSLAMTRLRNLAVVFFCAIASASAQSPPPAPTPSIVWAAHDPDAITDYHANSKIVRKMVDRLILSVTGQTDIAKAWSSLVEPNDKIGIKISAAGGELFTTHHGVVNAMVDGLAIAYHARKDIIVWDRSLGGIKEAGYQPGGEGFQLKSITPREGYDLRSTLSAPLLGKLVWGDFEYNPELGKTVPLSDTANTSNISHFSKIIANEVTKIINVPVMSNSEMNGIAGCLYNVTIPNIDNWRRFSQGSGFGAASIAEIYSNPLVRNKVVLNVMDGLMAQYGGGPQAQPNSSLHHATLYASKDAVALDAIALKRLTQWRVQAGLPPIDRSAIYIEVAGQVGLGNFAPARIELKNVGRAAGQ